jgi:prepilin-type N-terminal cleavage/methylation domain-containing protein
MRRTHNNSAGFSLVEVIVALFLMGLGVLAAAPMFLYAMQGNAAGADIGSAGALAVDRLEQLRAEDYAALPAGGSLAVSTVGFSDTSDPKFTIRWIIVDDSPISRTKAISVRVIPAGTIPGASRVVTLSTVRAP